MTLFCAPRFKQLALGLTLIGMAWQVSAQTQVNDAWVRATVPASLRAAPS